MQTIIDTGKFPPAEASKQGVRRVDDRRPELLFWALLLAVANFPLLSGSVAESLVFYPGALADGQWWRVLTFPFVHLSGYHLLLDAVAFLLLYQGLEEEKRCRRLLYVILPAAFSLLLSLSSPVVKASGLCGLSGVAHGLMAITALELISRHSRRTPLFRAGSVILAGVVAKTLLEVITGQVLFAGLHFGEIGLPVVASHAGGLVGGLIAFVLLNRRTYTGCTPHAH
jgi:rhomboid family GlyGly-CTERM serine protease